MGTFQISKLLRLDFNIVRIKIIRKRSLATTFEKQRNNIYY